MPLYFFGHLAAALRVLLKVAFIREVQFIFQIFKSPEKCIPNSHWEELLQSVSDVISANTADAHPGVSGMSKDQKFCKKFKNTNCQVDHPAKVE